MSRNRVRWSVAAIAVASMGFSVGASGDVVTHFGDGVGSDVPTLLDLVGIGSGNSGSETTAIVFSVPGPPASTTDLTFTMERDTGGFFFSFGFFDLSTVTGIDPIADKEAWATAGLAGATEIFDDLLDDVGATRMVSVPAGTVLVFYLIPNNTLAAFNANPGDFFPSQTTNSALRSPLFSFSDANPGELDQMLSFIGNGVTLFTFEDLTRTGVSDADFTDLGFTIDVELNPASGACCNADGTCTDGVLEPDCAGTGQQFFAGAVCGDVVCNLPPVCTTDGTATLWPPNHRYRDIDVEALAGVTDPDGDLVIVTITGIMQDEPINDLGDGNTTADGIGVGTSIASVRAERSGTGNGRVYHIYYSADDGRGGLCDGEVTVSVPHDQDGMPAVDDGAIYPSTSLFSRADVNADGEVDLFDVSIVVQSLGHCGPDATRNWPDGDVDWDGCVTIMDIFAVVDLLFSGDINAKPGMTSIREPR